MSSHMSMAIVAAIALSTPASADDPADAPIDPEIKAIVFDPGEAPIDTEMKIILWLESMQAPLWENTAHADDGTPSGPRNGPTIAQYEPAPTHEDVASE